MLAILDHGTNTCSSYQLIKIQSWSEILTSRTMQCIHNMAYFSKNFFRLGACVCFLVHPKAREFSRSTARSGWPHTTAHRRVDTAGHDFSLDLCSRIISRWRDVLILLMERRAGELNWRRWEAGETVLVFSRSGSCWLVRPLNIYRWDLIQRLRFEDDVAQWRGRAWLRFRIVKPVKSLNRFILCVEWVSYRKNFIGNKETNSINYL